MNIKQQKNKIAIFLLALIIISSQAFFNANSVYGETYINTLSDDGPQNGSPEEIIENTYPLNNQTQVEVKPTIKITFKYPIEILDKSKIILKTGDDSYPVDEEEIYLSEDEKTLCFDVGRIGKPPLMRNTLYRFAVLEGAVKLKDYEITNRDIIVNFITRSAGQSPKILGYSSDVSGSDDITSISGTGLSADGSVYIRFDRNIKWAKNTDKERLLENTKLYRIPKPLETDYDDSGNLYDKVFEFNPEITESQLKSEEYQQETAVKDIEIVNGNTVKVTPALPYLNLTQYHLIIKKEFIEDMNGYALENDVDFYFWTIPKTEKTPLSWYGIQDMVPDTIKDDPLTGGKVCTVNGTWAYGPENPFVFYIEGRVLPRAGEISFLKRITLVEGYAPETAVKISKVRFEYYNEGDKQKTKLVIYPENSLDWGKYYILSISKDVLQDRSGTFLPRFDMKFTVGGKRNGDIGIYKTEPDTFRLSDIYKGTASFIIKGYNFNEDIEYIKLKMISGKNAGMISETIDKKYIEFSSITELNVKVEDPNVIDSIYKGGSGEYSIEIFFNDGRSVSNPNTTVKVLSAGKPQVIATEPAGGTWSNEKMLNPKTIDGTTRYFLKITFEDENDRLQFDKEKGLSLLQTSTVFSEGQNEVSMIDQEFLNYIQNLEDIAKRDAYIANYIFIKDRTANRAYLFVPVKPLMSQTVYSVMINEGIVYFAGAEEDTERNEKVSWTFTTMATPVITLNKTGSVVENYDEDVPIILYGDFLYEGSVKVYFNNIPSRRVKISTDDDDKTILKVYLPAGSDRLDPGIYSILVQNDKDHKTEVFGALSVVKEGDYVPNEDYKIIDDTKFGKAMGDLLRSEDTLVLNRNYTDRRLVEIDLDDIMGADSLIRKICFDGRRNDRISTLKTFSKWADIIFYNVGIDDYSRDKKACAVLGRTDPLAARNLKQKLAGQKIKSEFIQVSCENLDFTRFKVVIPFKESDGENLKVIRYDPAMLEFFEEDFSIDIFSKTVTVEETDPGIFVVVED
ncbi:hypothetical protein [Tepidanaerobacter syntrophicus]|uniref:hypothetical protein n=1 Tax=Tepidanaerobacter syntrophicus TaxID=224999 RepID=UPI0023569521|nr:hypothetical protein [Tepidanaerobacter syntrophicus]